jgi:hypothetical protein
MTNQTVLSTMRARIYELVAERDALVTPLRDLALMVEDYVFSGGKRQVDEGQLRSALRDAKAALAKLPASRAEQQTYLDEWRANIQEQQNAIGLALVEWQNAKRLFDQGDQS